MMHFVDARMGVFSLLWGQSLKLPDYCSAMQRILVDCCKSYHGCVCNVLYHFNWLQGHHIATKDGDSGLPLTK